MSRMSLQSSRLPESLLRLLLVDPSSTGDEIAIGKLAFCVDVDYVDSWKGPPHASIKVFYRPRGKPVVLFRSPCPYSVQSY